MCFHLDSAGGRKPSALPVISLINWAPHEPARIPIRNAIVPYRTHGLLPSFLFLFLFSSIRPLLFLLSFIIFFAVIIIIIIVSFELSSYFFLGVMIKERDTVYISLNQLSTTRWFS